MAIGQNRHRKHGTLVTHDCLGNTQHRHGNSVICSALVFNDAVGAIFHLVKQSANAGHIGAFSTDLAKINQIDARNIGAAPDRQFRIAVLADDKRMNVAGIDLQMLTEQIFQAGSVKHGTRAYDALRRKAGQRECDAR